MKRMAAVLICVWLSACSSGPPLFTSDGRATRRIQCSASDSSWQDCFAQAHASCGNKDYDVISRSADSDSRGLLIACR